MNYTPVDQHERHAYIDRTIENALLELTSPDIQRHLGIRAEAFISRLSSATVANVRDGEIQIPDDYIDTPGVLPITGVMSHEDITLSPPFDYQTPEQKRNTISLLNSWTPRPGITVEQAYDALFHRSLGPESTPIGVLDESIRAVALYSADYFSAEKQVATIVSNGPSSGLVLAKNRPVIVFKMDEGNKYARAEDVAHELTHVDQGDNNPVTSVNSQRAADMSVLRAELEAYSIGSVLTLKRWKEDGLPSMDDDDELDHGLIQFAVESIRKEHCIDPSNPFMPSPRLLRILKEKRLGSVMKVDLDYEEVLADVNRRL